ncbi:hypothetical protein RAJCM14343_1380 [Rhodococcus aetherivorans]|uniref:Uncharacterized protein n=1 Tax=Rhodococcus aetherivorans TaxID=191292 RepID=A0ABQ0YHV4_9NOCA|nr:hypothetical protein RAJCM14343_1380 [Rhodococcus aetherivorans]CCW14832.1 hypothetical protein EBESD8_54030 [Rhodococcus aetherivorans]
MHAGTVHHHVLIRIGEGGNGAPTSCRPDRALALRRSR